VSAKCPSFASPSRSDVIFPPYPQVRTVRRAKSCEIFWSLCRHRAGSRKVSAGDQLFGRPPSRPPKSWLPAKSSTNFSVDDLAADQKVGRPPSRPPTFRWTTWRATKKLVDDLAGSQLFGGRLGGQPTGRLPDRCQQSVQIFSQLFARLVFGSPFKVHFWPPLL